MLSVTRHELKYFISSINADILSYRLSNLLQTDSYSTNHHGYPIKSLYFDTVNSTSLSEKQAGIIQRQKYRLRIYSPDNSSAKLEIKHKINQQIKKESLLINKENSCELVKGNFYCLNKHHPTPQEQAFYARLVSDSYHPTVIVSYWRKAFIYPAFNVRITLDRFLKGDATNLDLYSSYDTSFPVLMNGRQILEVKYDRHLPMFIRKAIQNIPLERAAISKYTLARRYLKQHKWEDN